MLINKKMIRIAIRTLVSIIKKLLYAIVKLFNRINILI